MDSQPTPSGAGLGASLRALGATLLEMLGTRAELAVIELREEADRRKEGLALAMVAGIFLALAMLLAALFVVLVFWDTHRLAALAGVTALYLAISAAAFLRMRARERAAPPPFEATLRELAADRELLRGRDE
ncbi:MAG TPA: phage holin family protein [Usitatibacter sp.]|nr:phage holin family protein [Usitatibacter sp.]